MNSAEILSPIIRLPSDLRRKTGSTLQVSSLPSLPSHQLKSIGQIAVIIAVTLFATLFPASAQSTFTRVTTGAIVTSASASTSSAVTWVDFDEDGDLDLYVSNKAGMNLLFRNDGGGNFTQITNGPVVNDGLESHAVSWADLDNDGRLDVFIGNPASASSRLFLQQRDSSFVQSPLGSLGSSKALGAAWADYDNDGWVDLVVAYFSQNVLWHNNGEGGFSAVTNAGIDLSGDAISWADYDNDGDMDLLVTEAAGSGGGASRLYRNEGHGVFTRITTGELAERSTFAYAAAWADYNNDGFLDLFLPRSEPGQALPSFLFKNNTDGTFTQVLATPFTNDFGFGVSAVWGDYDNDGWLDLFVGQAGATNLNRLYHNNGDGTFSNVLTGPIVVDGGDYNIGCWGDYDRDGFLDLFVSNGRLYHNDGNSNSWITIKCIGTRSNRSAIGAKVRVKATINGKTFWQLREINTGDGWAGNPLEAHFGLGDATNVETLRIEWPSGTVQEFQNVRGKQYLTLTEPSRLVAASAAGILQLILQGGRNLQYDIQSSTDLAAWSPLVTLTVTNINGTALITEPNTAVSVPRFYRAVLH